MNEIEIIFLLSNSKSDFSSIIYLSIITYILFELFWNTSDDDFLHNESKRCLEQKCEINKDWHSQGRIYGKGIAFYKNKEGKVEIINQAKLIDIGLL